MKKPPKIERFDLNQYRLQKHYRMPKLGGKIKPKVNKVDTIKKDENMSTVKFVSPDHPEIEIVLTITADGKITFTALKREVEEA